MNKNLKIWKDGRIISWEKATIHVLTHTFHYGGGAFEGIRFYNTEQGTAIFRLKEHLDRLYYSASCLDMKVPFSREQLTQAIIKLIKINKLATGYIRPIVFYGSEHLGLHPQGCRVHSAIAVWPWGAYLGTKPVRAKISRFTRIHPKSTYSEAKICGHYVNSILASIEAIDQGFDEAILLDYKGNLAEGPGENIFIVKKGVLLTPPPGNILRGITRKSIIEIARNEGIKLKETTISKRLLFSADEAFYSGTAAQISAIKSIDNKTIGKSAPGPVTKRLASILSAAVHGEIPKYQKWLTYVD